MSSKKYQTDNNQKKPLYVRNLETFYGPPNQEAFGSVVFYENMISGDLKQVSLEKYRYFVGKLWNRYGEDAWMGMWKEVYRRKQNIKNDIVNELKSIIDRDALGSVSIFLDGIENPEDARKALAVTFDDPAVTELTVHNIGDGAAMSGLLISAFRKKTGDATFVIFLMD
jgi:hypothetical protein